MKTKIFLFLFLITGSLPLHSQNTWQCINSMSDTYLYRVYAISPDTVFVIGKGLIAKSTDYGNTWQRTITPDNVIIKDIIFCDKETGFAVGEKGSVYKTTDSGITWDVKTSNTTNDLNAVAYVSPDSIWTVGNSGTVLNSLDGGETWQQKDFSTSENLNDIIFSENEGYIIGSNVSFYKTINAGVIWNKEAINLSGFLYKIQKTGNNMFLLVGDNDNPSVLFEKKMESWNYYYGQLNGFNMINDTLGYSSNSVLLTNGGENVIYFNKLRKNDGGYFPEISIYRSWTSSLDINHSDISVANDTMIYVLSGNVLLKSSPDITTDIKKPMINKELFVFQSSTQRNELIVQSHFQPIAVIELFNISGNKILNKRLTTKLSETSIDISHIPVGVYLAKVVFENKRQSVCKWIKQ